MRLITFEHIETARRAAVKGQRRNDRRTPNNTLDQVFHL